MLPFILFYPWWTMCWQKTKCISVCKNGENLLDAEMTAGKNMQKGSAACSAWRPCPDRGAHSQGRILWSVASLSEEGQEDAKALLPSPRQIQTHRACNWAQRKDSCSCQSHVAICPPSRAVPCCHLSPRQPGRSRPSAPARPVPWDQLSRPSPGWCSHTPFLEVHKFLPATDKYLLKGAESMSSSVGKSICSVRIF